MKQLLKTVALLFLVIFLYANIAWCQPCVTLGQTPSTAFPVCGITTFQQDNVPLCKTNDLFVPGCSGTGADYANKNPFFYKFTCYSSGTLGFLITPNAADEDYDWQLYDITGHNPNDIFTDKTLIVSGNWSGTYGPTGASASGVNFIQCASNPVTETKPTFAVMPNLIQGHQYILMISHFTDTQSGYSLSFGGGTAVITDPAKPHMLNAKPGCDGKTVTLKLNKKISCPSLTISGSEFSISPAITAVVSATAASCSIGFDFDEVDISLASALPNGNYQLIINNGSDGNSLLDICGNAIAAGEQVSFQYDTPQPTPADSVGRVSCSSDTVRLYFPKKINCSSIAANGSDFSVSGPTAVTVSGAYGNCINGKTDYIVINFASPIYTKGNYLLSLKTGSDGTTVIDECGQESPMQSLPFNTADTVSAEFQYSTKFGCQRDTLTFAHDGAHDVNSWNWIFNNTTVTTQTHTIIFPASSNNNIKLAVSTGVCSDSASAVIVFDNEVKSSFTMPDFICPEDKLEVTNTSTGKIDTWRWNFDVLASSTLKDPLPFVLPSNNNRELYLTIKLVAFNNTLGCSDSSRKILTVLNNCFIAVPSAFTPNNDGLNDYFGPHNAVKALNLDFKVFNRWGQLVFHSHNWREKWDGKINGVPEPTGVYVWMLTYTHRDSNQQVFQKGTVTLIR